MTPTGFRGWASLIERADNTAKDPRRQIPSPAASATSTVGGPLDYFQWAAILRSVSALTSYRWVYRESVKPWLVADLLILNLQMPRSLASCYANLSRNLDLISQAYGRHGPAQRQAYTIRNRFEQSHMAEIFQAGLHEFITEFIGDNNKLGAIIARTILDLSKLIAVAVTTGLRNAPKGLPSNLVPLRP